MILPRLGFGLTPPPKPTEKSAIIWIHALSVGEVASTLPLLQALRTIDPSPSLILSVTTISGKKFALQKASAYTDAIIFFPFDILPVVNHFIKRLEPKLFILVETDFWPNFLHSLKAASIPALLVNGRISQKSIRGYQRFSWFFKPLFDHFQILCMQTANDALQIGNLGVDTKKLKALGNLKYADYRTSSNTCVRPIKKKANSLLILCGSTHAGEEEILFPVFHKLKARYPNLQLAVAPRKPERSDELVAMGLDSGFSVIRYSEDPATPADLTIIDTLGDLSMLFGTADIAFIGGSLVPEGGHNPLEAARQGCPVLFGPHMEDFSEISAELLAQRAAFEVSDPTSLETTLENLLCSTQLRLTTGQIGRAFIERQRNIVKDYLQVIKSFL